MRNVVIAATVSVLLCGCLLYFLSNETEEIEDLYNKILIENRKETTLFHL